MKLEFFLLHNFHTKLHKNRRKKNLEQTLIKTVNFYPDKFEVLLLINRRIEKKVNPSAVEREKKIFTFLDTRNLHSTSALLGKYFLAQTNSEIL